MKWPQIQLAGNILISWAGDSLKGMGISNKDQKNSNSLKWRVRKGDHRKLLKSILSLSPLGDCDWQRN